MSRLALTLLFYFLMMPTLPIMMWVLLNGAKPRKNVLLGVTLPYRARLEPEVEVLVRDYKRWVYISCAVAFVLSLGVFFFRRFSLVFTWLMLWLLLAIALPHLPYILYHRRLRALKRQNGWYAPAGGDDRPPVLLVDTKAAAQPVRVLGPGWFLPPFALSLVPVGIALFSRPPQFVNAVAFGVCALLVPMFYGLYRLIFRQRAEVVDEDSEVTVTLTNIRRRNWGRCWLASAWLTGVFNFCLWFFLHSALGFTILVCLYSALVLVAVMGAEFSTRNAQFRLTQQSGTGLFDDQDDYWIWGLFYYNPTDNHLMVNERVGNGMSMNLAKPSGKVLAGVVVALLLTIPLMCAWIIRDDFTPVTLHVSDTAIVASHPSKTYEIPLGEVEAVSLVEQKPQHVIKTNGTGLDTVSTGRFNVDGEAQQLCLNPQSLPFLRVETPEGVYLLGGNTGEETLAAYQALTQRLAAVS